MYPAEPVNMKGYDIKSKRVAASGLTISLLIMLLLCPVNAGTDSLNLLLVFSARNGVYEEFRVNFTSFLAEQHSSTSPRVGATIYLDDANSDELSIPPGTDLVVTIGSRAARALRGADQATAILNTLVPESVFNELEIVPGACRRHSAIYIDQPVHRQIELARLMFPGRERLGFLLGPVSAGKRRDIETAHPGDSTIIEVTPDDSTMNAGHGLFDRCDALIAINDPHVMNREDAKWLLYVAYQKNLPIIGFSRAYVKAGAAAAVVSDAAQLARQAAETVIHRAATARECLPDPQYPRYFGVAVNQAVSRSLGSRQTDEKLLAQELLERETR